jgi:DNA-binding MarR family transcriptional regulator
VDAIAERLGLPGKVIEPAFMALEYAGYLERDGAELALTERGRAEFDRLAHAWRDWIVERLADWRQENRADLNAAIDRVANRMIEQAGDEQRQGRHALV